MKELLNSEKADNKMKQAQKKGTQKIRQANERVITLQMHRVSNGKKYDILKTPHNSNNFIFLQKFGWAFSFSGMWHCVIGCLFSFHSSLDIWAFEDETTTPYRNVGNQIYIVTVLKIFYNWHLCTMTSDDDDDDDDNDIASIGVENPFSQKRLRHRLIIVLVFGDK